MHPPHDVPSAIDALEQAAGELGVILVALAEQIAVLAAVGLLAVLVPPVRNRLLGVGRPRVHWMAVAFGLGFAIWGAQIGPSWLGYRIHTQAIGIFVAALLGGARAGLLAGLGAGLASLLWIDPDAGVAGVALSVLHGGLLGWIDERRGDLVRGWRVLWIVLGVQAASLFVVALATVAIGDPSVYLRSWPALLVQMLANAAGTTLFVLAGRLVLAREETARQLAQARLAADTFELQALRSRLEPHFLFNALNTLRATIRTDPAQARELVSDLADLYRYLLSHPEDAPLSDEVEHARAYLAIEKARLGKDRLRVETSIDEEISATRVPALLLQPIVENAVTHGVAAHAGPGTIEISAARDGALLVLEVSNRSPGEPLGSVPRGSGIALRTLRNRLEKRFGDRARLDLQSIEGGMRARISLPLDAPSFGASSDTSADSITSRPQRDGAIEAESLGARRSSSGRSAA